MGIVDHLRPLRRVLRPLEAAQVRRFGSSLLGRMFRTPVLVLETTGRRSGRVRATALAYLRSDEGELVVVGGAGGQQRTPDWVANLRADPNAHVTVDRQRLPVVARELVGDERTLAWSRARRRWPQIDGYEARAGRRVPVFALTPS